MFRLINTDARQIEVTLDGEAITIPAGITVAAALLLQDQVPTRVSAVDGTPRAPHCLMGACFECLVEIDGSEQRACQVEVHDGMRVTRRLAGRNK